MGKNPRIHPTRKREPESDDNGTNPLDDASDFQRRHDQATTLTKEGQLAKACSALLDEPPAPYSDKAATMPEGSSSRLHRFPSLPRSRTPCCPVRLTRQPDRLGCAHNISKGSLPRLHFHTVVRIMAAANVLGPTVSWIASASLTALRSTTGFGTTTAVTPSVTPSDVGSGNTRNDDERCLQTIGFGERLQPSDPSCFLQESRRAAPGLA